MNDPRQFFLNDFKDNPFGEFSADGREFHVTHVHLPRPWVNVLANPHFGLVVSHTGSGFTFVENSQLSVLTRWQQDLADDTSGKFLYLFIPATGELCSLSPAPTWAPLDAYRCIHRLGSTTFLGKKGNVAWSWTLLAHPRETAELWLVELKNLGPLPQELELTAFLEWNCGVAPSPRREFSKLFLETQFLPEPGLVLAESHMWDVSSRRFGHWNTSYPFVAAFGADRPPAHAQGDKALFFGPGGSLRHPLALQDAQWEPAFGRHWDPVAALRYPVALAPYEKATLVFVLAAGKSRKEAVETWQRLANPEEVQKALEETHRFWDELLGRHSINTPDDSLNAVLNWWSRYQAIAGRLWARCGYYQQSGAFGFRDQLQDAQVFLPLEPQRTREQILLHAAHQFADGSAYHWWHPLTEEGLPSRYSDDYLWLAFVTANYLKETGDFSILEQEVPFLDAEAKTLTDHIERAFALAFSRFSPRGLPLIGCGDWNDGLSACGLQGRGESVWLAHFLVLLTQEWSRIFRELGEHEKASSFQEKRNQLIAAINQHAWDGEWFWRASLDDGSLIGSHHNSEGRIFLNAQSWAILAESTSRERQEKCWRAVKEHLFSPIGALLLTPAYTQPNPAIGYITRYAPGVRENGGVYTHASTWALAAACKMRDHEAVAYLLRTLNPALKDPRRSWAEPYVLPGNVDGPPSPLLGRAGWSWYTGSAAWFHRVVSEWVLGVRPTWDGLQVDPCLPSSWSKVQVLRQFRGAPLSITMHRQPGVARTQVLLEGKPLEDNLVPPEVEGPLSLEVLLPEEEIQT